VVEFDQDQQIQVTADSPYRPSLHLAAALHESIELCIRLAVHVSV